jgi:hypothetical protein
MSEPISNGSNGRDAGGRFAPGNPGGPGAPTARYARQLRERLNEALFKICSPDRLLAAVDACMKHAEAGDIAALKLLVERIAGPPIASDLAERLERLEEQLGTTNAKGVAPWASNND